MTWSAIAEVWQLLVIALKNVPFFCHATSSLSFSNMEILAVLTTSFCEVIVTAPQSNEFERSHSTNDKRIRYIIPTLAPLVKTCYVDTERNENVLSTRVNNAVWLNLCFLAINAETDEVVVSHVVALCTAANRGRGCRLAHATPWNDMRILNLFTSPVSYTIPSWCTTVTPNPGPSQLYYM